MSVVAKFRVDGVENRATYTPSDCHAIVKMSAVGGDSDNPEDTHFATATPTGKIEFTCTNPDALEAFQPGDLLYVRFDKAE